MPTSGVVPDMTSPATFGRSAFIEVGKRQKMQPPRRFAWPDQLVGFLFKHSDLFSTLGPIMCNLTCTVLVRPPMLLHRPPIPIALTVCRVA